MKYYLGYYKNPRYIPIKDSEIGDNLTDIVGFTTQFSTINEIKAYLYSENLIPSPNVYMNYVIEKGTKDRRVYYVINSTDKIYTSESKQFFTLTSIKEYLVQEGEEPDFVMFLCYKYIIKFGYLKRMINYLLYLDINSLIYVLKELKSAQLSSVAIEKIESILNYLSQKGEYASKDILEGLIEAFYQAVSYNTYDVANMYTLLKGYVKFRNIPAMNYLYNWLKTCIINHKKGYNENYISNDGIELNTIINEFFNNLIYYFDYDKKAYKMENGSRKKNIRELFDLGVFIEEYYSSLYEEYIESLKKNENGCQTIQNTVDEIDEEDEPEEFLEEEDFIRMGQTSEEAGYNLRFR